MVFYCQQKIWPVWVQSIILLQMQDTQSHKPLGVVQLLQINLSGICVWWCDDLFVPC